MSEDKKLNKGLFANLKYDIPSGLVVFLVAVPLCMGIALASKAPIFSGLIAGIIGGLVIPFFSRSELSVSGPAAGLIAIVIMGIEDLGGFNAFLVALVLAGLMQLVLGLVRAGTIAYYFPSAVIKGMLAGIGVIIILKQIPHAIGMDEENFASDKFSTEGGANTFSMLLKAFENMEFGVLIVGVFSILMMIVWKKTPLEKINWLPAGLGVVVAGVLINLLYNSVAPGLAISSEHLVDLGGITAPTDVIDELRFPDWSTLKDFNVYVVAATIAVIASLETLLCIEAVDRLDPYKRKTPMNRELFAQGIGNTLSGLIGGLPITSVIVRSSTNVSAGGRTRMAAIVHGLFLLLSVVFLYNLLNMIPLASLAAILILVGYNLAKPSLFKKMYHLGWNQFIPFIVTVIAIVVTDLLTGIVIGLFIGIFYILKKNFASPYFFKEEHNGKNKVRLELSENVTFMNKASIRKVLEDMEETENADLVIDASKSIYIDYDVIEMLYNFQETAENLDIKYKVTGIDLQKAYDNPKERITQ